MSTKIHIFDTVRNRDFFLSFLPFRNNQTFFRIPYWTCQI